MKIRRIPNTYTFSFIKFNQYDSMVAKAMVLGIGQPVFGDFDPN